MPRGEPRQSATGKKHTVYLNADQEQQLLSSGLKIGDVVTRGLMFTPVSKDGTAPGEYREPLAFLAQVAGVLAGGGRVFTALATDERIAEVKAAGESEVDIPGTVTSS